MKKLLFIVGLALTSLTVSAQEQEVGLPAGLFTLEWKFNPFDYESKPVKVAQLNGRLFLNDKSAVRLGLGVGFDKDTDENSSKLEGTSTSESFSKITNDALTLRLSLGYEYHFANVGHLDFYGGFEGGYLGRFYSATKEYTSTITTIETTSSIVNTTYENAEYKKRSSDGDKLNENGIFGSVFTGIDYYIYKKLYIGAELGITFNMGKKSNGNYTEVKGQRQTIGTTVVSESASKYSSETGIYTSTDGTIIQKPVIETKGTYTKVYIEPSIRIGWMF
jgi:hypothetical protein